MDKWRDVFVLFFLKQARKGLVVLLNGCSSETAALNKSQSPQPAPAHILASFSRNWVETSKPANPTGL